MDFDIVDDISDEEYLLEDYDARAAKRYIRDANNPVKFYDDKEFKRRFRFSKDCVDMILPKIRPGLEKANGRDLPITPLIQLLLCLRYYATGSIQLVCADMLSTSQSTASRVVTRVTRLLAVQIRDLIKMPSTYASQIRNWQLFEDMGKRNQPDGIGIPGIDGAIDCSHVRLSFTKFEQYHEAYRNRKGYFSLNVQAVVGPRMEFLDIVPTWAGSEHDSRIFQNSRINMRYAERQLTVALLGDGGYASMPYLFTSLDNPVTEAEQRYNMTHRQQRSVVEHVFGVWKRRFPCLSKRFTTKLEMSTTIVVAYAVPYNIALLMNDAIDIDDDDDMEVPVDPPQRQQAEGLAARRELIRRHFTQVIEDN